MTHEEVQDAIPAYVASKLEREDLTRLEAHLLECDNCAELAAAFREIAAAVRTGGEAMFDAHPDEMALRAFALGESTDGQERIERHVAACASCELQVSAWRLGESAAGSAAKGGREHGGRVGRRREPHSAVPWVRRRLVPAVVFAAGVIFGFAIATVMQVGDPSAWSGGPIELRVLLGPTRGEEPDTRIRIRQDQPQVVIPVRLPQPDDAAPAGERLRLEILDAAGASVFEVGRTRSELERELDESRVMSLMLPRASLPDGRYEVRLIREGVPGDPLFVGQFEILAAE